MHVAESLQSGTRAQPCLLAFILAYLLVAWALHQLPQAGGPCMLVVTVCAGWLFTCFDLFQLLRACTLPMPSQYLHTCNMTVTYPTVSVLCPEHACMLCMASNLFHMCQLMV
jgi:hypothetical protein